MTDHSILSVCLTFSNTIPTFNDPEKKKPFENVVGKEKMLVTTIFPISHNVFYLFRDRNHHFSNIRFVVCKPFQIFFFFGGGGKELTLPTNTIKDKSMLSLYNTITTFKDPKREACKNIVGKGENAGNRSFLLFPQSFLLIPNIISILESHLFCSLRLLLIWG